MFFPFVEFLNFDGIFFVRGDEDEGVAGFIFDLGFVSDLDGSVFAGLEFGGGGGVQFVDDAGLESEEGVHVFLHFLFLILFVLQFGFEVFLLFLVVLFEGGGTAFFNAPLNPSILFREEDVLEVFAFRLFLPRPLFGFVKGVGIGIVVDFIHEFVVFVEVVVGEDLLLHSILQPLPHRWVHFIFIIIFTLSTQIN